MAYLYDRQSVDTPKSWQAFNDYCRLGSDRSLAKLLKVYRQRLDSKETGDKPPTQSINTLYKWSYRCNWQERVAAYDGQQDLLMAETQQAQDAEFFRNEALMFHQRIRELSETQLANSERILEIISKWLKDYADPADLSWVVIPQLLKALESATIFSANTLASVLGIQSGKYKKPG